MKMKRIHKISLASPIDFAAEELKKYLRMMSPEGGDVIIDYDKNAVGGFRLGLMQDLGLDVSGIGNTELDDAIYIKTDADGGIVAGCNPRSVLIAVYELLRRNGCRWLFPGVDGEYIPSRELEPVEYTHIASSRYRGSCIEGSVGQQILLDYIDFLPKLGMNTYMFQFRNPFEFYDRYYDHARNESNFASEVISKENALAWTRMAECEMDRRGLLLHSVGHGWTVDPFGIDSSDAWNEMDEALVPDEARQYLAMIDGKRMLRGGRPLNTQFCMSNRTARKMVADYITDYAASHSNVDYLHVWLGDSTNNHCECPECVKMSPTDWYVRLLNDIDESLSQAKLATRVVFIAYTDTMWAPVVERIKNPDRFTLMIAPISRDYSRTLEGADENAAITPYVRNKAVYAKGLEEFMLHFAEWKKVWGGRSFVYEYHFYNQHNYDLSGMQIARRIYDDIVVYRENGFDGIVQCGTPRSFHPNGLAFYTYARFLFDGELSFDEILDDYYAHAYGEAAGEIKEYLAELGAAIPHSWLAHGKIAGLKRPELAPGITRVREITAKGREIIKKYYNSKWRAQTVSIRLLEILADSADRLADVYLCAALGNLDGAEIRWDEWGKWLGTKEPFIEQYLDHLLMSGQTLALLKRARAFDEPQE